MQACRLSLEAAPSSLEPGREKALDVAAATRSLETRAHDLVLHDDEGRHLRDPELLDEIGPPLTRNCVVVEGLVVAPALKHLRDVPLDPPAASGDRRMEEDETGFQN